MIDAEKLAVIISVIGVLVALTNIITQVLKKATFDKMPTNILAVIVSEVLTICTGLAYLQINKIDILWYMVVGIIVLGFMVSYAAMFGFDKLREIMGWKK